MMKAKSYAARFIAIIIVIGLSIGYVIFKLSSLKETFEKASDKIEKIEGGGIK